MPEKSRLQILVDNLDHEAKEQIVRILEANVDKSLRPLPRAPEGAPIARLAENFISGRTDLRTAMDNLLFVGGKSLVRSKPTTVLKFSNPLLEVWVKEAVEEGIEEEAKEGVVRDLCLLLHIDYADEVKVETLPWGKHDLGLVFYSDGRWTRRVSFDRPEILEIVQEKGLNVAAFLSFVVQEKKFLDGNEILAISDSDKIAQFLSQNGIGVHVQHTHIKGDTLTGKGVGALQEDARPSRESTPIKDFGKLEFDGSVLTRNGGMQIFGENPKDDAVLDGMVDLLKNGILRLQDLTHPFSFISSPIQRSEGVLLSSLTMQWIGWKRRTLSLNFDFGELNHSLGVAFCTTSTACR